MRCLLTIVCAGMVAVGAARSVAAQTAPDADEQPQPLTNHELLRKYVWNTLGFDGAAHAALTSAFEQWRGSPEAWPRDRGGYAERLASEYGASAIGSTTKYGVARLRHEDPSFVRCDCTSGAARLRHAIASPFVARKRDGRTVFSPATVAGIAAQNVVPAATWYPAPRGVRDGAAHAASGVVSKMIVDVVREFLPPNVVKRR
jgi:hypothetical protein